MIVGIPLGAILGGGVALWLKKTLIDRLGGAWSRHEQVGAMIRVALLSLFLNAAIGLAGALAVLRFVVPSWSPNPG